MVNPLPQTPRSQALLSLLFGVLYIGLGAAEILSEFGLLQIPFCSIMDGFILLVIGAVFVTGFLQLRAEEPEPVAFLVVGLIIATVVFFLRVVIIGSNLLGWILGLEDWADWSLLNDITLSLWVYLLTLLLVLLSWVVIRITSMEAGRR